MEFSVGQQKVLIKGFVDRVEIFFGNNMIASHQRHYGQEQIVFNPIHYLKLLERKIGAFEQASPLTGLYQLFLKKHSKSYAVRIQKKVGGPISGILKGF